MQRGKGEEEKRRQDGVGGKSEIRNDMMTGSSNEPSRNVILSEASQRDAKSKDLSLGAETASDFPMDFSTRPMASLGITRLLVIPTEGRDGPSGGIWADVWKCHNVLTLKRSNVPTHPPSRFWRPEKIVDPHSFDT